MLKGFREFISKGNAIDLAVGVIIGAAFSAIVNSLVVDIITPIIGLIFGRPDFSAIVLLPGPEGGGIMVGNFLNAVVSFLLTAVALYFFIVVPMNAFKRRSEKPVAPPTEPELPADVKLLAEIRDLLAAQQAAP
jgi:large conductance mechanosensitive channel